MLSSVVPSRITKPRVICFTDIRAFFGCIMVGVVSATFIGVMIGLVSFAALLVVSVIMFYRNPHFISNIIARLLLRRQAFLKPFRVKRQFNYYVSLIEIRRK